MKITFYFRWDQEKRATRVFKFQLDKKKMNSATYSIDGKTCTLAHYREQIRDYNIQVQNPCVFLAQDKVAGFASQNAQVLLKNTEEVGELFMR